MIYFDESAEEKLFFARERTYFDGILYNTKVFKAIIK